MGILDKIVEQLELKFRKEFATREELSNLRNEFAELLDLMLELCPTGTPVSHDSCPIPGSPAKKHRTHKKRSKKELIDQGYPMITVDNARVQDIGKIISPKGPIKMILLYNGKSYAATAPLADRADIKAGHHVSFTALLDGTTFLYLHKFQHIEAEK